MRLHRGFAVAWIMTVASLAHAELTGTVTPVSDYDLRGISQSAQDPALQASLDWTGKSGLYLSGWASSVDFGDCCDEELEVDIYGGFRGGDELAWDVGFIYYSYPGTEPDLDYPEIYAGLGWSGVTGKIYYSNDFGNSDK